MNGFNMRWVDEPQDPEVAEWLREILAVDPADTSACPLEAHTGVPVQAADQMAVVDTAIAKLVHHLFRLGITVHEACEHVFTDAEDNPQNRGPVAMMLFCDITDAQTLLTLIAREDPEDGTFYARITGDSLKNEGRLGTWQWHIEVATIGRKPILQPRLIFPVSDLEEFTIRLAAAAL